MGGRRVGVLAGILGVGVGGTAVGRRVAVGRTAIVGCPGGSVASLRPLPLQAETITRTKRMKRIPALLRMVLLSCRGGLGPAKGAATVADPDSAVWHGDACSQAGTVMVTLTAVYCQSWACSKLGDQVGWLFPGRVIYCCTSGTPHGEPPNVPMRSPASLLVTPP